MATFHGASAPTLSRWAITCLTMRSVVYWSGRAVRYICAEGGTGLRSGTDADPLHAREWAPAMVGIAVIASDEPIGPSSALAPSPTSSVTAPSAVSPTFEPAVSPATGASSTPPPALMSSMASDIAFCWAKPMSHSSGWLEAMKPKVSFGGAEGATDVVVAPAVGAGAGLIVVAGAELAGPPLSSLEQAETTNAPIETRASNMVERRSTAEPYAFTRSGARRRSPR